MGKQWTKQYRKKVIDLYAKTKNAGLVAEKLGKFRSSILRVLKQEGVYQKPSGKGEGHSQWKGGRSVHGQSGYWTVFNPNHHRARKNGRVYEHILVAEKKYGIKIKLGTPIHHIDLDRLNNHPENIYMAKNHSNHKAIHTSLNKKVSELIKNGVIRFKDGIYY